MAALAGVPAAVLAQARARLAELEQRQWVEGGTRDPGQMALFAPSPEDPLSRALADLDPDALSPRQALEVLYELKALAGDSAKPSADGPGRDA